MYYLHVNDVGDEHSSGLIVNVIATSHTRYKQIITSSSTAAPPYKKLIT